METDITNAIIIGRKFMRIHTVYQNSTILIHRNRLKSRTKIVSSSTRSSGRLICNRI